MKQREIERIAEMAAQEARRLEPWATALFGGIVFLIVAEEIAEPLWSAATSSGHYPWSAARQHIAMNVIGALPSLAILYGVWEARVYLSRLARSGLWSEATSSFLNRLGAAVLAAALAAAVVAPALLGWISPDRDFALDLAPIHLALVGLGGVFFIIARIVRIVIDFTISLDQDHRQIV